MPKLTKADISNPTNFQHISGIDTETGGSFNLNDNLTPKTEPNECDKTTKKVVRIISMIILITKMDQKSTAHKGPMRGCYPYKMEREKGSYFPILGFIVVINQAIEFLEMYGLLRN